MCPILSHCFSAPNSFCSTYCTTLGRQSTFCSRVSWRQNAGLEEGDGSCALLFASCWNPFCSLILEEQHLGNASSPLPVLSWSSSWIHLGFLPLHWWKYAHPATPATPVSGDWCPLRWGQSFKSPSKFSSFSSKSTWLSFSLLKIKCYHFNWTVL